MSEVIYAKSDMYPGMGIQESEFIVKELWWQKRGLSFTKSGYGSKIPTQYMVYHSNRLKRVYIIIYSNSGSLFIMNKGKREYILN